VLDADQELFELLTSLQFSNSREEKVGSGETGFDIQFAAFTFWIGYVSVRFVMILRFVNALHHDIAEACHCSLNGMEIVMLFNGLMDVSRRVLLHRAARAAGAMAMLGATLTAARASKMSQKSAS
jgi:hypothetical protein